MNFSLSHLFKSFIKDFMLYVASWDVFFTKYLTFIIIKYACSLFLSLYNILLYNFTMICIT